MVSRVLGAIVAALLLLPASGSAQTVAGVARVPGITVTRDAPAPRDVVTRREERPSRTPVPPPPSPRDLFLATPDTYAPRYDRRPRRFHHSQPFPRGYGYAGDFYVPAPLMPALPAGERMAQAEAGGFLRLIVEPLSAHVYVDGYFVGTVAEFSGALAAGAHRIEVTAQGFNTLTFAVRIFPGEVVAYRNQLSRIDAAPQPPVLVTAPAGSKTLYIIPRCYAGDTPPQASQLPAGCDLVNLRTVPRS